MGMDTALTIGQLCELHGIAPDTARKRWTRAGFPLPCTADIVPDENQTLILLRKQKADKQARTSPVRKPDESRRRKNTEVLSVQTPPNSLKMQAFEFICISVCIGHAGLVFMDCWTLWGKLGFIGGGVVFLIMSGAVLIASDNTRVRTSENMMYFVWALDLLAWFVHYKAFTQSSQGVDKITTGCFVFVLCACSAGALSFYRDSKID